jgi:hypothetical protein
MIGVVNVVEEPEVEELHLFSLDLITHLKLHGFYPHLENVRVLGHPLFLLLSDQAELAHLFQVVSILLLLPILLLQLNEQFHVLSREIFVPQDAETLL